MDFFSKRLDKTIAIDIIIDVDKLNLQGVWIMSKKLIKDIFAKVPRKTDQPKKEAIFITFRKKEHVDLYYRISNISKNSGIAKSRLAIMMIEYALPEFENYVKEATDDTG